MFGCAAEEDMLECCENKGPDQGDTVLVAGWRSLLERLRVVVAVATAEIVVAGYLGRDEGSRLWTEDTKRRVGVIEYASVTKTPG